MESNCQVVSIGGIELNPDKHRPEPDYDKLPLLPTRNLVLFPGVTIPLALTRDITRKTANTASEKNIPIGIVCQRDKKSENNVSLDNLYEYGVVADVIQVIDMPDGEQTALVRGRQKFKIEGESSDSIIPGAIHVKAKLITDKLGSTNSRDFQVLMQNLKEMIHKVGRGDGYEGFHMSVSNLMNDVEELVNTAATNLRCPSEDKLKMLATPFIKRRAFLLYSLLVRIAEEIQISDEIKERAKMALQTQNRNMYLQQQLNAIREELYGDEQKEIEQLRQKAKEANLPEHAASTIYKEIDRLARTNSQTPDYGVLQSYIETVLELPWHTETELTTDFAEAESVLENDHFGLEKVKERILEQMAVMINHPKGKSPIICFVGAPGVGKTSLGVSIAKALGRNYHRVALGGLHDEAEIRGHRRTYIGAMPGRIIDAVRRAKSKNPVILLDEIDKIGADFKGDPSAALLEVLDPEQNCRFHDNYIDVDFDLSNVFFIATANTLTSVSKPLLDRMEIIEISGYIEQEKLEIARRHLLPRIAERLNAPTEINISDEAILGVIEDYTAESGVRQLEKSLTAIVRKAILRKMQGKSIDKVIERADLKEFLGLPIHRSDLYERHDMPGVATGLAWTAVGGEILYIEASLSKGKGEKITLTGNLGDVMKESAIIALQYVKANAEKFEIDESTFDTHNVHIHVPEGAIPKDGPSAGITMATAIISAFTGRKVRNRLAMTGEITLRGKVLPVGGIKEKILAAKRAGITDIVLCRDNRRDVEDIKPIYIDGLKFHYVDTVSEVVALALSTCSEHKEKENQ